jgi:glycine/D-amino acid oxidase-like deaminating enzyme
VPIELSDNCYLIHHPQGWFLWDTGLPDALAATPEGTTSANGALHVKRPKTLAGQLDELGVKALCERVAEKLGLADPQRFRTRLPPRQACFRPVTEDGLPFIGAVPGVGGAYVATGHSVWGMLNAPATGEAMSELILDGAARHVDLAPFAPGRLPPLDPTRLRGLSEARFPSATRI